MSPIRKVRADDHLLGEIPVITLVDDKRGNHALLSILEYERLRAVVDAARAWHYTKRPLSFSDEEWRANPTSNCVGPEERALATALSALDGEPMYFSVGPDGDQAALVEAVKEVVNPELIIIQGERCPTCKGEAKLEQYNCPTCHGR